MTSDTEKYALRKTLLDRRRALRESDVARKGAEIHARLRALPGFTNPPAVLTYVDAKDNEVPTQPLIALLFAAGMPVFVPVIAARGQMRWSRLEALDELAPARFGLLEPPPGRQRFEPYPARAIVLVPGIGFCTDGRRIGYGGGYFDRFLPTHPGTAIGLAFECQMVPDLPVSEHDRAVDMVVTESGVYRRPPG